MASWRDSATQQAQDDLDGLVNVALTSAQQILEQRGEFFPYAVTLDDTGEPRMVAGDPGLGDQPTSGDLLAALVEGLAHRSGRVPCDRVGLRCSTHQLGRRTVELEHRDGHAMAVVLPYKKRRFGRGLEFGDLTAAAGRHQIWGT